MIKGGHWSPPEETWSPTQVAMSLFRWKPTLKAQAGDRPRYDAVTMGSMPPFQGQSPYPRDAVNVPPGGSAEKLEALGAGYHGLTWVFAGNIVVAVIINGIIQTTGDDLGSSILILGLVVLLGVGVAIATFPQNKKIGFGLDWQSSGAIIASVLMGLNSALCCGIIGYIVMQQLASNRMKQYGLRTGFLGVKKSDIAARVAELRQSAGGAPPPMF
jgi:hypothetical protein